MKRSHGSLQDKKLELRLGPPGAEDTVPGPAVGWPPIRSFRRNLTRNTSSESRNVVTHKVATGKASNEASGKGLFVKINMDGVPIGRKVDLKAYDSYEKLSTAVHQLFTGFLAGKNSSGGGLVNKQHRVEPIMSVSDGSEEYTLVYEDNEGDRVLVGDVPWHMFISTVKRLRILKRSQLSATHV